MKVEILAAGFAFRPFFVIIGFAINADVVFLPRFPCRA
jgi:hypothetical protein